MPLLAARLLAFEILLLALGAVLFTTVVIGVVAKQLMPSLPWAAAIALGAIVAPPDAVSATSVLKNFKLPRHIVTVLEGESLINDASALVLYRFAVTATLVGSISLWEASWSFLLMALGGTVAGLVIGFAAIWLPLLSGELLDGFFRGWFLRGRSH